MPSVDAFAAAEARLGASLLRHLSNATLTLPDGVTKVDGFFRTRGREAPIGMGMITHDFEFSCALAGAPALAEGDPVVVEYRGVATGYLVAERLSDDLHLQHAEFALRLP